jgi:membrane associated rhomboid family serine protease
MNPASVGHQCPECVAEGRRTQRPVRTAFGATRAGVHGYVTIGLIVINCVMLLASVVSSKNPGNALLGGGIGFGGSTPLMDHTAVIGEQAYHFGNSPQFFYLPYGIPNGEYYRLITAMFMHYGLIHLAVNMYSLWILGRPLEAMLGPVRFGAVYLVCGLGGNVAAYVFSPSSASAGASTAIFGLLGVYFFVLKRLNMNAASIMPVILINLVFTFTVRGISIPGHIGGLLIGALVGYGVTHAPQTRRTQIQAGVLAGTLVVLGLITVWQTHQLNHLTPPS